MRGQKQLDYGALKCPVEKLLQKLDDFPYSEIKWQELTIKKATLLLYGEVIRMNHYLVQVSNKAFVFGSPQLAQEQQVKISLGQTDLGGTWADAQVHVFSHDQVSSLKTRVATLRDLGEVKTLHFDPLTR